MQFVAGSATKLSRTLKISIWSAGALLILISAFLCTVVSFAQRPADRNQPGKGIDDPAILRWKILLSSLAQESRTAFPEDRRPYAMVEVANAYWEADRDLSRQLYISALDMALSLTRQEKKNGGLINYVLSAASRRDPSLAKELNTRLVDNERGKDDVSIETAQDMVDENPLAAAQLAEAFAPAGLSDGTAAFLIFSIAKKDIALSDRVYSVYLNKTAASERIEIDAVSTLAGYAFGYSEYYTISRLGSVTGASFLPIAGLSARPQVTSMFVNLAERRLARAIDQRDRAVGAEIERLNYSIFFALEYLIPEVAKFAPEALPRWRQLQQRGIVGVTTAQAQQVSGQILEIQQARLRTQKLSEGSQTPELDAETSLEGVDKLPGICHRDVIRTKASLLFSSRKNSKRALEITGTIEDLKQAESVKQAILISDAESAIENGELEDAETRSGKVSSIEQKTRLYILLADAFTKRNDRQRTQEVINESLKLLEKAPDAGDQAAMLFSLSSIVLRSDHADAQTMLRGAVKYLNKKEAVDEPRFSIPIKVSLSCPGEAVTWYGGIDTLPTSNIFDAIALFATQNPDEAIRFADEISDKITRIRAYALISKVALYDLITARRKVRSNPR